MIVLSMISLKVKTCSVVDLFGLQAACDGGISASNQSIMLVLFYSSSSSPLFPVVGSYVAVSE